MGMREETIAAVSKGRQTFKDAFDHNRHENAETSIAWSGLYGVAEHLKQALEGVEEVDRALQAARKRNGAAAENWSAAFAQPIGAGAAQSDRPEVITALAHAQHEGSQTEGRRGVLEANLERIAPFLGMLKTMVETVEKDMIPELRALDQGDERFTRDHVEVDGQWQSGPGIVDMKALWDWEKSI